MNDKMRKFIRDSIIYLSGFVLGCIAGMLVVL